MRKGKIEKRTARELGIPDGTFEIGLKKYMNEANDKSKEKNQEKRLRKELQEKDKIIQKLQEEVFILKKSIEHFVETLQQNK